MSYRVVKKINGCHYLYDQETYREGGKVRTRSQYLGAVDPQMVKRLKTRGEPVEAALITLPSEPEDPEIKYTVELIPKVAPPKKPVEAKPETSPQQLAKKVDKPLNTTLRRKTEKPKSLHIQPLRIKSKVERHNISRVALEGEHRRFVGHMEALGLKTERLGLVLIGTGKQVRCRRQRSGNYVITLPRLKVKVSPRKKTKGALRRPATRVAFKREYRKALAGVYLDAIKAQDPKYYAGLEQNLSAAYKAQNKAISRYIMNSGWKTSQKIGLTLHYLHSKMLSNWSKSYIPSEIVGLADHERRDTWRQDAEAMMSEIQKFGWNGAYSKYMKELSKAESLTLRKLGEYRKAGVTDRLSGKRRKYAREFRKLNARSKALNEACNKISVLSPLFQSYNDNNFDGRSPFMHEGNWQTKKARWQRRHSRPPNKQPPAGARRVGGGRVRPSAMRRSLETNGGLR